MNKYAHRLILVSILFISALIVTRYTFAVETNSDDTDVSTTGNEMRLKNVREVKDSTMQERAQVKEEVREQIEEKRQERVQTKCEIITTNIDKRLEIFSENKDKHVERYNELKDKVEELVDKLDSRGYDVTALKNDLMLLDEKIQKFAEDYVKFIDLLKKTQGYACGQSEGMYAQALAEAKKQLLVIRQDASDIKNFYLNVIKADLRELREQSKNMVQTEQQETTSSMEDVE